jgi:hypothetical protein
VHLGALVGGEQDKLGLFGSQAGVLHRLERCGGLVGGYSELAHPVGLSRQIKGGLGGSVCRANQEQKQ